MDASPDVLADSVRAKRTAIDNDLEVLRVKLRNADPRRRIDAAKWAQNATPIAAGIAAMWWWARRRRSVRSLDELLLHDLTGLYATEHALVPALSKLAGRANDPDLRAALEQHLLETEGQIDRLERVFRSVGRRPSAGSSEAVRAVLHDAERLLKQRGHPDVRDAWIIETAQRVEHIEMANYGTARTFADLLGYTQASQLLQQTLEEERLTDQKLTLLAERFVNPRSIRATK